MSRGGSVFFNEIFSKPGGIENELNQDDFFMRDWKRLRFSKDKQSVFVVEK